MVRYEKAADEQQFTMEKFKTNAKRLKDVKESVSGFSRKVRWKLYSSICHIQGSFAISSLQRSSVMGGPVQEHLRPHHLHPGGAVHGAVGPAHPAHPPSPLPRVPQKSWHQDKWATNSILQAVKKLFRNPGEQEEDTGRCEGCDEELSGEETEEEADAEEEEEDWNITDRVKMVAKNACWMQEVT